MLPLCHSATTGRASFGPEPELSRSRKAAREALPPPAPRPQSAECAFTPAQNGEGPPHPSAEAPSHHAPKAQALLSANRFQSQGRSTGWRVRWQGCKPDRTCRKNRQILKEQRIRGRTLEEPRTGEDCRR